MASLFKKVPVICLSLAVALTCPLSGEIERITVNWNPQVCLDSCVTEITRQLRKIGGIAEIAISQPQGQADIRWKPLAPFSYDFIRSSVSSVGAGIRSIRLQVRGTLVVTPGAVLLQSLGDNTKFVLLSPAQQNLYANVPQRNLFSHILAPEMRQQLTEAARQSAVVVVKGPLLQPQKGLYLVIEQLNISRLSQ